MKKLFSTIAIFIFTAMFFINASATIGSGEYARYIASMENTVANVPMNFAVWDGCKMPVKWTLQTAIKDTLSGYNALKVSCSDNTSGSEWHATGLWFLTDEYSNWQGAQYLEFWIKNDTGVNFALQIQMIEFDKNKQPSGEPWRTKVKTEVLYEEGGTFVKRTSDVSSAETYNAYSNNAEGAIAIPKNYSGRIRVAINANNFYRALWYIATPGDGSNNTIDKNNMASLSFNYDPRVMESNATWYLDSIKLVAPNSNLYKSVAYSKLNPKNETNAVSQNATVTSSKATTAVTSNSVQTSSVQSTSNNGEVSSSISNSVASTSAHTDAISKVTDDKGGMSIGALIAIIAAIVIMLAGGGAVTYILVKSKKGA